MIYKSFSGFNRTIPELTLGGATWSPKIVSPTNTYRLLVQVPLSTIDELILTVANVTSVDIHVVDVDYTALANVRHRVVIMMHVFKYTYCASSIISVVKIKIQ